MRIALFTIDSLASHQPIRTFIEDHSEKIALVGLSRRPPRPGKGFWAEAQRHYTHSGAHFSAFMLCNFVLPRWFGAAGSGLAGAQSRPSIKQLCGRLGIPLTVLADVNADAAHELLRRHEIDLVVSCYFDQIFSAATIAIPPLGVVNVHTSLLPGHRGPMPVLYGWLDRPPSLGVTIHRVDEGIDTGPLLGQESCDSVSGETIMRAMTRLHDRGLKLLGAMLPAIERSEQSTMTQTGGSYERFPSRATLRMFLQQGGRLVDRRDVVTALTTRIDI